MQIYEDGDYSIMVCTTAPPKRTQHTLWEPLRAPKKKYGTPSPSNSKHTNGEELGGDSPQAKKQRKEDQVQSEADNKEADTKQPADDKGEGVEAKKRNLPEEGGEATGGERAKVLPEEDPDNVEQAKSLGWAEEDKGGDGDCFFRAWVAADGYKAGKKDDDAKVLKLATQLRLDAVKRI